MRYAKTFFAALAVTVAAAAASKTMSATDLSTSAVCNKDTKQCVVITWADGSKTL